MVSISKLQVLNTQYEQVCNEWIRLFCEKQEIDFDGWIGDEIGGKASFIEQYCFNLSDIILDLNTNQPKWTILNWQSEDIDHNFLNDKNQHINYKSYTMGLRHSHL